jgi:hypothetical protein
MTAENQEWGTTRNLIALVTGANKGIGKEISRQLSLAAATLVRPEFSFPVGDIISVPDRFNLLKRRQIALSETGLQRLRA